MKKKYTQEDFSKFYNGTTYAFLSFLIMCLVFDYIFGGDMVFGGIYIVSLAYVVLIPYCFRKFGERLVCYDY